MTGVRTAWWRRQRTTDREAAPLSGAAVPWALAGASIATQVAYPLLDGRALRHVTFATVLCSAAACASHAWVHRGPVWASLFTATVLTASLAAEAVGLRRGVPFGRYAYTGTLGPTVLDVPLVVPLAWLMIAYPSFVVARRTTRRSVPLVGALAMTGWDVFLDPQMVAAGHWAWEHPTPALPGVPGVPLTNYAGWVAVSAALMAVLDRLPRHDDVDDSVPGALWGWGYLGSLLGNAVFFRRPGVAAAGGVAMGLVAVPDAVRLWRRRRVGAQPC